MAPLIPLIRAAALPGVGGGTLRRALEGDGLDRLIARVESELSPVELDRARGWARRALATIRATGMQVLTPADPAYPHALQELSDPPCPLFALGRLELLDTPLVAVVGTRAMTSYGREVAHRMGRGIAASGATVVSGLARGVDGVAHRAAGPARTVAVVGCGLDVAFPTAHAPLQEAIAREGLLLGEQIPGTPPMRHNFPRRNRIIAALARGVVVVEAPPRSGALSTAARAREHGRDVFAVPGPVGARSSVGTNALIRDGATLVTGPREVLEALGMDTGTGGGDGATDVGRELPPAELNGQALALWRVLGPEPVHAQEVAARAGLPPQQGLASLLALELQGYARQVSGLRFARLGQGAL